MNLRKAAALLLTATSRAGALHERVQPLTFAEIEFAARQNGFVVSEVGHAIQITRTRDNLGTVVTSTTAAIEWMKEHK